MWILAIVRPRQAAKHEASDQAPSQCESVSEFVSQMATDRCGRFRPLDERFLVSLALVGRSQTPSDEWLPNYRSEGCRFESYRARIYPTNPSHWWGIRCFLAGMIERGRSSAPVECIKDASRGIATPVTATGDFLNEAHGLKAS